MKQNDINEAEWRNPANWTWRGPLGMYASKRDTRVIAPKAAPYMGLAINCAHPACTRVLLAIALLPILLAAVTRLLS